MWAKKVRYNDGTDDTYIDINDSWYDWLYEGMMLFCEMVRSGSVFVGVILFTMSYIFVITPIMAAHAAYMSLRYSDAVLPD